MDEAARKRKLIAEINALPGAYARRWEDRWAVGLLDLVMKLPGYPVVWGEGKIIDGLVFAPTERQWVEGKRIIAAGMKAILIGWKRSEMFISPWVQKAHCDSCFHGAGPNAALLQTYLEDHA
jgi:hypothetical protein